MRARMRRVAYRSRPRSDAGNVITRRRATTRGTMPAAPSGSNAAASDVVDVAVDSTARDATRVRAARAGIRSMVERYFQSNAAAQAACAELRSGADMSVCANVDAVVRIPARSPRVSTFGMEDLRSRGVLRC